MFDFWLQENNKAVNETSPNIAPKPGKERPVQIGNIKQLLNEVE